MGVLLTQRLAPAATLRRLPNFREYHTPLALARGVFALARLCTYYRLTSSTRALRYVPGTFQEVTELSQFTQREFLFLDDAMHAAQVHSKCFEDLAQRCQEPAARDLCVNLSQMHQRHFDRLLRHMNAGQGQQYQQTQAQWMYGQTQQSPQFPPQPTYSG